MNWNEGAAYEREKKRKMDLCASHEQAREEGIQQEKYVIANSLLATQLDRALIAQVTGLSQEVLQHLA